MKIIGITGPTGAGKTTALNVLAGLGGEIVDCDAVYHELLEYSEPMKRELTARFGRGILSGEGRLDRKLLGQVVFQDQDALLALNAITHRYVGKEVRARIAVAEAEGRTAVAIDAIALIESGLGKLCHAVVGVLAPAEVRVKRIVAREGITEEYARLRVAAQKEDAYFRANCTHILENSEDDTPEIFAERARVLFKTILGEGPIQATVQDIKEENFMEEKVKTIGELRREALLDNPKNGYDRLTIEDEAAMKTYCEDYKKFLDAGKTERECVDEAIRLAEAQGFKAFTRGMTVNPGEKLYRANRGKALMLAVVGSAPLSEGVNIGAAHIDAPRLDLKQRPLYEDSELAFLKTHYYGGIRKYQWVTIPLELHGVVALKSGATVKVTVGNGAGDPVFTIDDLLPHLAQDQSKKPLNEAIPAESLNILVGSRPYKNDEGTDRVKLAVMDILNQKYGITETDFISAELAAVPAFKASDVGFDRSMIGAYGHDDRVCSFAALAGIMALNEPRRTAVCMLADKEEIGSEGVTGMKSAAFDTFMSDLCDTQRIPLKACYEKSFCLSADVTAAFDPNFPEVYEKRNSALVNYGMGLCKYTGSRGKSGASDATAEVVGYARRVLDDAGVMWQMAELGKADQGGGGTVAVYMAERDIDTLDAGVPVLSMHAPFETVSKLDCYMTYKGMKAIYEQ
ncbi:Dephospho-CoA kinase [uncultured Eubacteriales bacterium]|uniref:Dephospho-CoA kinase n=1 Tax=uncultured Eubacteriales bacterium TaxID=172733 RepID=A0A212JY30_9FIRM|nr:Dephospho-CoA kinase [uncultured Eubacteriales bacterium]